MVHAKQKTHENNTVEALLEPGHGIFLLYTVLEADTGLLCFSLGDSSSWTTHDNVEVHTEDTDTRVVPGTKVNVLLDTETEVAGLGEVLAAELVLLDLEAALKDLLGLGATDGDVDGNLLVTTDTERADGVTGLGGNGGLTGELLQNLGGTGETITGLADGDVCARGQRAVGRRRAHALITSLSMRSSFMGFVGALLASAYESTRQHFPLQFRA